MSCSDVVDSKHRFLDEELRMVLIGITGSGKSACANSILGDEIFKSDCSATSITTRCQQYSIRRFNRKLIVVDTPGLMDTGRSEEEINREIMKCIGITAPGPHAFILVLKMGCFTKQEAETVDYFKKIFGDRMMDYLFVLFTGMDQLQRKTKQLDDYIKTVPQHLKEFLKECGDRYFGINNMDPEVEPFIDMIKLNVTNNGGKFYTAEVLSITETRMRKREQEIVDEKKQEVIKQWKDYEEKEKQKKKQQKEKLELEYRRKEEELKERQRKAEAKLKAKEEMLRDQLKKEGELQQAREEARQAEIEKLRALTQMKEEHDRQLEEERRKMREKEKQDEEERRQREREHDKEMKRVEEEAREKAREQARLEVEQDADQRIVNFLWAGAKCVLGLWWL